MALVSKNIPNLINGVSQQPASLRLESQGEAQENGLSDVVDGLKKRPPTKFLKKLVRCNSNWLVSSASLPLQGNLSTGNVQELTSAELASAYIHTYKRSSDEQYTVVILPDATTPIVLAYDILGNLRYESDKSSWLADGSNITYTDTDPTTYLEVTKYGNDDDTTYLVGLSATALDKTDLTSTSVADATFIVNKTKTVEMDSSLEPEDTHNEALVYLKSTNYGREYTVKITSQTKNTTIDSNGGASGNTPVATGETNSNNASANLLRVSNVISTLRSNLVTKGAVAVNVLSSRKTPYGYAESRGIGTHKKLNQIKGNLFIPFGGDNQSIDPAIAGTSNTVANKYLLQVTAGGRVVPHGSFNIVTAPYAGIEINANYAWETDRKKARYQKAGSPKIFVGYRFYPSKEIVVTKVQADQTDQNIQFYPHTYNEEPFFVISTLKSDDATDISFGDFDILVTDDDGGSNLRAFKDNAKSFTDLPNQCVEGFRIGVVGDNQKKEDNFHVEFTGNGGSGYWKETVKAGIQNKFDLDTMPHTLRQDPDQIGSLRFSFNTGEWDDRVAGDEDTNPAPSFVGQSINDIFFHRNRLGIIAGENVIFSEASGYFNFFRTTVRSLLDSAPIDVAVSQNEVSILKAAIPVQDNLLLFSELNQFTLSAAQLLTPTEVTIDQSTKFECDLETTPVGAGNSVFFATKAGGFAGIREYYTNNETEINDATLITSHIPQYLEGNVRKMAASSNENILVCLTNGNKREAYIYNWYDQSNERLQSAWSKWKFAKEIEEVSFNNATLYLVFNDGSFESLDLAPSEVEAVTTFGGSSGGTVTAFNSNYFPSLNGNVSLSTATDPYLGNFYINRSSATIIFIFKTTWNHHDQINSISLGSTVLKASDATVDSTGNMGISYTRYAFDISDAMFDTMDEEAADITIGGGIGYLPYAYQIGGSAQSTISFNKAGLEALLDHQVRLEAETVGGTVTSLTGLYNPTFLTNFVNYKGEIVATGNSAAAQAKVVAAISQKTHLESGEVVNDYVYAGEPYQFKYQLSEQVYKPAAGDFTDLSRLQLRSMSLNYNDTGTFTVDVKSKGRDIRSTDFTGRILGQKDNILDYSPIVESGSIKVGVQSQAKETDITITNDSHLPCVFQSAEWEGFLTLRNKRL